jgi:hypothetical protein
MILETLNIKKSLEVPHEQRSKLPTNHIKQKVLEGSSVNGIFYLVDG